MNDKTIAGKGAMIFMKKNKLFALIALVLALSLAISLAVNASAAGTLDSAEIDKILNTATDSTQTANAVTAAVAKVRESVVVVRNYQMVSNYYNNYFGFGWNYRNNNNQQQRTEQLAGIGSGTVITAYGHILTNAHVIEDASRVTVYDGENEYEATVIATDETRDIAVLLAPDVKLAPVELGDSDQLLEGETAIVIGNPLGENYMRSITVGVVSSLGREFQTRSVDKYGRRENVTNTMIQVDAAINSGNSGGGMFNVLGQLMGIPSAYTHGSSLYTGVDAESIGWCIPINDAKDLIRQALESYDGDAVAAQTQKSAESTGSANDDIVTKPRLGISMTTISDTNTAVANGILPRGCLIREVEENSPAAAAGLQAGDIIVEVDDTVITDATALQQLILSHSAGDTVNVKVFRTVNDLLTAQTLDEIGEGDYIDIPVTLQVVSAPAA